jgi:hypothetical protein
MKTVESLSIEYFDNTLTFEEFEIKRLKKVVEGLQELKLQKEQELEELKQQEQ